MLRLRTLGGLSIESTASIGGLTANRRPLALLALLAVNGRRGLSRDTIIALLWPESDAERGRNSLSQVVSLLRRELSADDVLLGTGELRLNPDVLACDVIEFEDRIAADDLEAATRSYTGPFLDGAFLKNTPEFERWVDHQRSRLHHAQADALERLATRATTAGDHVSAVRFWRLRASLVPTDSRAARELMASLVASGDPAGALAHHRIHEETLRDEMALEPDAALAAFVAEIRRGMGRLPASPATATRPPTELPTAGEVPAPATEGNPTAAPSEAPARKYRGRYVGAGVFGAAFIIAIAAVTSRGPLSARASRATASPTIAVRPFRVIVADSASVRLQQEMADLVTQRLTADGMMRVAAPRIADRIIDGSITGTSRHLVISAWIRSQPTGRVSSPVIAEGPVDSVEFLIDRLAGQLLGMSAGVADFRLASLAGASLPAIRTYLRGLAEWRRGQAEASREHFRDALASDSTFALAALGYARALLVVGGGSAEFERARSVALANQAQLSSADRELMNVTRLQWESSAEHFRVSNSAVVRYPTAPDLWYSLGDTFYRDGVAAGIDSSFDLANVALRRGRQLDSVSAVDASVPVAVPNVAQPTLALVELAHIRGDSGEVRRLTAAVLAYDSSSDLAGLMRWHLAAMNGLAARRAFIAKREEISQYALTYISVFIDFTGIAAEDRPALAAEGERRRRVRDAGNVGYAALAVALNKGRPGQASLGPLFPSVTARGGLRSRVHEALSWGGDTVAAASAVRELQRSADAPTVDGPAAEPQFYDVCAVGRWRSSRGDFAAAQIASRRLRAAKVAGLDAYRSGRFIRVTALCAALLDAERATRLRLPEAGERLLLADSLSRLMDAREASFHEDAADANFLLAMLWEAHGDIPRALRAARRRCGEMMRRPSYLSSFLREEGRLAALVRDTTGAIRAYRQYLVLHYDPEPSVQPEVDHVRRELATLLGGHHS
jgi:DNA-binding SARP family transcriptional activator